MLKRKQYFQFNVQYTTTTSLDPPPSDIWLAGGNVIPSVMNKVFCILYLLFLPFVWKSVLIPGLLFANVQVINSDENTRLSTVKFVKQQGRHYTFPQIDDVDHSVEEKELKIIDAPDVDHRLHYSFRD